MSKTIEEARKIIKELSREDKEILSGELVQSVNQSDSEIHQGWINEAEKRAVEIIEGQTETVDGEAVMQRLKSKVYDKT